MAEESASDSYTPTRREILRSLRPPFNELHPIATKWRWYVAPGKSSRVSRALTPPGGYWVVKILGRAIRSAHTRRSAEAETNRDHFGLGDVRCNITPLARPMIINSTEPRAAQMLVKLACCLPGATLFRHYVAVAVLPNAVASSLLMGRRGAASSG